MIEHDAYAELPTMAELAAQRDLAPPGNREPGRDAAASIADLYPVLDWHAVWTDTPDACRWLVEPVFERGRLYAVYAPAKIGKSLLLQDIAAGLATGGPVLGKPAADPVRVLYIDAENSVADVVERLSACGYTADDLDNLRYLSFPSLPALNSRTGGEHLRQVAAYHGAEFVIIDTISRVVEGKENDADTYHELYRHALAPLKAAGITVARLDHAGKDQTKGQRGSSAKTTDVDTVWLLEQVRPATFALVNVASRTTHSPGRIEIARRFEPLRHEITATGAGAPSQMAGVMETVATLARLQVPTEWGRQRCRRALTDAGVKVNNATLTAAIHVRQTCPGQVEEK